MTRDETKTKWITKTRRNSLGSIQGGVSTYIILCNWIDGLNSAKAAQKATFLVFYMRKTLLKRGVFFQFEEEFT